MYQPEKVIRILAKDSMPLHSFTCGEACNQKQEHRRETPKLSQKQKGNKDTADRSLQI